MATVARQNIGLLNDKLTVQLNKEDYLPVFEKKLKEYSKTMNVPGFRKGMVPAGMVKKMYGPSIFTDEVLKTVEQELFKYLQAEQPDIFAQPMAMESTRQALDMNNPADYSFDFEIGLKPAFEIAPLSSAQLTLNTVAVTDEMVNEEVGRMQVKAGKMTEPETVADAENVLNIQFTELGADGAAADGGISKENSVLLKYFTPALQAQWNGKQKDAELTTTLDAAFTGEHFDAVVADLGLTAETASGKSFSLKLVKIGLVEKHELNEELFNQAFPGGAVATEEEFRLKLKEEIAGYWGSQSRNQLHDQLYHYLLDHTNMEFPATFLKRWLQHGGEKPKTAEEADAEYPMFESQLKWTLISDKIIREQQLQVNHQEVKDAMREEVMRYFGAMSLGNDTSWLDSYIDRMMKDEKHVDSTYRRLVTEKLFQWAEGQVTPASKEVTPEELAGMMHHHHH